MNDDVLAAWLQARLSLAYRLSQRSSWQPHAVHGPSLLSRLLADRLPAFRMLLPARGEWLSLPNHARRDVARLRPAELFWFRRRAPERALLARRRHWQAPPLRASAALAGTSDALDMRSEAPWDGAQETMATAAERTVESLTGRPTSAGSLFTVVPQLLRRLIPSARRVESAETHGAPEEVRDRETTQPSAPEATLSTSSSEMAESEMADLRPDLVRDDVAEPWWISASDDGLALPDQVVAPLAMEIANRHLPAAERDKAAPPHTPPITPDWTMMFGPDATAWPAAQPSPDSPATSVFGRESTTPSFAWHAGVEPANRESSAPPRSAAGRADRPAPLAPARALTQVQRVHQPATESEVALDRAADGASAQTSAMPRACDGAAPTEVISTILQTHAEVSDQAPNQPASEADGSVEPELEVMPELILAPVFSAGLEARSRAFVTEIQSRYTWPKLDSRSSDLSWGEREQEGTVAGQLIPARPWEASDSELARVMASLPAPMAAAAVAAGVTDVEPAAFDAPTAQPRPSSAFATMITAPIASRGVAMSGSFAASTDGGAAVEAASPWIHRAPLDRPSADGQLPEQPPAGLVPAEQQAEHQAPESAEDLDGLADAVFDILRWRLAAERERSGTWS